MGMTDKTVKKMLVSYNPKKPDAQGSDFVVPLNIDGKTSLFSIKTGKVIQYGLIVFVGKSIAITDILKKIHFLSEPSNQTIQPLNEFINNINVFKIGDIIEVDENGDLKVVSKQKKTLVNRLP